MNGLVASFKREYWEHKRAIVGLPVGIGTLLVIAAILAIVFFRYAVEVSDGHYSLQIDKTLQGVSSQGRSLDFSKGLELYDKPHVNDPFSGQVMSRSSSSYSHSSQAKLPSFSSAKSAPTTFLLALFAVFMGSAWFSGLYYLLSSLNADRKDNSILFWKSLPVSETQNVLVKLVVGALGFVLVAVVVAWLTYVILMLMGLTSAFAFGVGELGDNPFTLSLLLQSITVPLLATLAGLLLGAPLFTYVLMVSAMAKRSPFGLLVVPPIALMIAEKIIFNTRYIFEFISIHSPFKVLKEIAIDVGAGQSLPYFIKLNLVDLLFGLFVSVFFTVVAIWYRNNKFEV